jgi:hypothetical protein
MAALGAHQTLVVAQDGRQLLVWGKNKRGKIAIEDPATFECPSIPIEGPAYLYKEVSSSSMSSIASSSCSSCSSSTSSPTPSWTAASCGFDHCCAVSDEGR